METLKLDELDELDELDDVLLDTLVLTLEDEVVVVGVDTLEVLEIDELEECKKSYVCKYH